MTENNEEGRKTIMMRSEIGKAYADVVFTE